MGFIEPARGAPLESTRIAIENFLGEEIGGLRGSYPVDADRDNVSHTVSFLRS